MKTKFSKRSGYSLVEILVTSTIMMAAIAAACTMTLVTVSQEEAATRSARALNYFENAMRLYQLGLDPVEIATVLPVEPSLVQIQMTEGDGTVAGVGVLERMDMRLEYRAAQQKDHSGDPTVNSHVATGGSPNVHTIQPVRTYPGGTVDLTNTSTNWVGGSGTGVRQVPQLSGITDATWPVYRTSVRAANTW
ncbi:MAG: hypothetical protein AAGA58_17260 [Verrucomicrobiota bacterium]